MTSRRFARAASTSLHFAKWVVFRHGTNVTRVTRGKNIFNNKIYIGDLASTTDVRCPAAKYRSEYQEVPATVVRALVWFAIKVLRLGEILIFRYRFGVSSIVIIYF